MRGLRRYACFMGAVLGLWTAFFGARCLAGSLDGPIFVEAGNLAFFESETEGAFLVFPPCPECYSVGKDGRTLYFASKTLGKYCVIFAGIQEGKPILETFEFTNGDANDVNPSPTPDPNKTDLSKLTSEELNAASWGFGTVVTQIDKGRLTTTQGARATFKYAVGTKVKTPSEAFNEALDSWTTRTNWETIQAVRKSFAEFKEEIDEAKQ